MTEVNEVNRETMDETGVGDQAAVVIKGPDGEIKHADGVKGPDPDLWGDDEDRPNPFAGVDLAGAEPIPQGTILYEDLTDRPKAELQRMAADHDVAGRAGMTVETLAGELQARGVGVKKGPGPLWERDEEGRYVNR